MECLCFAVRIPAKREHGGTRVGRDGCVAAAQSHVFPAHVPGAVWTPLGLPARLQCYPVMGCDFVVTLAIIES